MKTKSQSALDQLTVPELSDLLKKNEELLKKRLTDRCNERYSQLMKSESAPKNTLVAIELVIALLSSVAMVSPEHEKPLASINADIYKNLLMYGYLEDLIGEGLIGLSSEQNQSRNSEGSVQAD